MSLKDWFHLGTKKENTAAALGKKYEMVIDQFHDIGGKHPLNGKRCPPLARVCRIRALRSFGDVKAGDLGGFIESEKNLSQDGNCWVYDKAEVWGNALIYGDAQVRDQASVHQEARIGGKVRVVGCAHVWGHWKSEARRTIDGEKIWLGFNCPPGCCRQGW